MLFRSAVNDTCPQKERGAEDKAKRKGKTEGLRREKFREGRAEDPREKQAWRGKTRKRTRTEESKAESSRGCSWMTPPARFPR